MKRLRSEKVDVDGRGKACKEKQATVLWDDLLAKRATAAASGAATGAASSAGRAAGGTQGGNTTGMALPPTGTVAVHRVEKAARAELIEGLGLVDLVDGGKFR